MNEIVGRDVMLEVYSQGSYLPFLCCTDMSISFTPELVNVTTKSSGRWNDYRPRRIDWTVAVSGVSTILGNGWMIFDTVAPGNLFNLYQVRMTFTDEAGNAMVFAGTVLLDGASISGNQEQFSQWDNSFQGCGAYTLTKNGAPVSGTQKLTTPILAATAVPASQISLTWGAVANASGYRLYRSVVDDLASAPLVATLGPGSTSYDDMGLLSDGVLYYYWLIASGDGLAYTDSDPGTATAMIVIVAGKFLLEWGWYETDPYPSIAAGGALVVQGSAWLSHGANLSVLTQFMPQGYYLVARAASVESGKTTWFNSSFNNGTIPDTVFQSRLSLGGYNYYITRVKYYHDASQPTILS